jgi:hypothetical protein
MRERREVAGRKTDAALVRPLPPEPPLEPPEPPEPPLEPPDPPDPPDPPTPVSVTDGRGVLLTVLEITDNGVELVPLPPPPLPLPLPLPLPPPPPPEPGFAHLGVFNESRKQVSPAGQQKFSPEQGTYPVSTHCRLSGGLPPPELPVWHFGLPALSR